MRRWGISVMTVRGHQYTVWFDDPEHLTDFLGEFQAGFMNWQYIMQDITARVAPPNTTEIPHEW